MKHVELRLADDIRKVAVDVGYSRTKAASARGTVCVPSVVAAAENLPNGVFTRTIGHTVRVRRAGGHPEEYLVGEAALGSLGAVTTLSREKPREMHDLLVLAAAYLCGAGTPASAFNTQGVELAVGLPLAYVRIQKDALKERLEGLAAWVSVDGGPEKYIRFRRVLVLPQGAAVLASANSIAPPEGYVGLVDVGCYTTDFLMVTFRDGAPAVIPGAWGSLEAGTHLIQRAIADEYQRVMGAPLAPRRLDETMRAVLAGKPVRYRGTQVNLHGALERTRRDTAKLIAQGVLAKWADRTDDLAATLIAGGGALVLGDKLVSELPGGTVVSNPVFANTEGFFHLL